MPPFLMEKIIHVIQVQENRLVLISGETLPVHQLRSEGLTLEKSALKKTLR